MNPTTNPALRSFVPVESDSHFPIQNLPYGVFRTPDQDVPRIGVRIGDAVLDLRAVEHRGHFAPVFGSEHVLCKRSLNKFMASGMEKWRAVREIISRLLSHDEPMLRDDAAFRAEALIPTSRVTMELPCEIGDYTDFYSSREHATNVGTMLRGKEQALQPNWLWLPVGYHGRASSIVLSGTDLLRPRGQTMADNAERPEFGPSRSADFELEMGFFIGPGNELGRPIPVDRASRHIFGMVIVNDWSARDLQKWEYVPLGPFLAKNFGTTISPWVVSMDALEPFRCSAPAQDHPPLDYLIESPDRASIDIRLEVAIQPRTAASPHVICRSNFRHLYWSMTQQLAHHTSNGCNLRPGDLLASGTISGPTPDSFGSLLELSWRGSKPLSLPDGQSRSFIQDYDRITMTAYCQASGYRVGFGECSGRILPAEGA